MSKEEQEDEICRNRALIVAEFVTKALSNYNKINKGLPTLVAIYRDGVGGPSYKDKVLKYELDLIP